MLGDVYALNTVIDDARRLSFVNFGEIVASHHEAVAYADRFLTVPVPRRFRTVVTSAAGYPLDQTYYQTVKGMVTPLDIVDHDATLIVASDCSEGLGSDAFRASQRRLIDQGADAFLASLLEKRFADIDEWESRDADQGAAGRAGAHDEPTERWSTANSQASNRSTRWRKRFAKASKSPGTAPWP